MTWVGYADIFKADEDQLYRGYIFMAGGEKMGLNELKGLRAYERRKEFSRKQHTTRASTDCLDIVSKKRKSTFGGGMRQAATGVPSMPASHPTREERKAGAGRSLHSKTRTARA